VPEDVIRFQKWVENQRSVQVQLSKDTKLGQIVSVYTLARTSARMQVWAHVHA